MKPGITPWAALLAIVIALLIAAGFIFWVRAARDVSVANAVAPVSETDDLVQETHDAVTAYLTTVEEHRAVCNLTMALLNKCMARVQQCEDLCNYEAAAERREK